jgi:hypothetical protein
MMKPRKGKVRCENQMVTFASEISVAVIRLRATSHPGLSGADFIVGFKREQVNLSAPGKMATGNPCIGLVQADRGRPGRSSEEDSVMERERRTWLVGLSKDSQLRTKSG